MEKAAIKHVENGEGNTLSSSSSVFKQLQWVFLIGYLLAGAGDNLQGSYRYALYDSYGINRSTIELFSVASYGSALLIGTFVASLADRYGRRLACFLVGIFYILTCFLYNFSPIWILIIANIFWGIANAFYHTGFEAWLIQEHRQCSLDGQSLKRILRNANVASTLVAIGTGVLAQVLVTWSNYTAPFNMAIVLFILMIIFLWKFWPENYGNKQTKSTTSFILAIHTLRADPRIVLLGLCSAFFEASLYIFVIEWTPVLLRAASSTDHKSLPLGFIFAGFLFFEMIGSFVFEPLAKRIRVQSYMIVIFPLAAVGLAISIILPKSIISILIGFCFFEMCAGIYRPTISLLRSLYIPNEIRATMMNYLRVPQYILMFVILLGHFSLSIVFILCISYNLLAMLCMIALRGLKLPQEQAYIGETEILLDEPSSPLFDIKRPQIRSSSSASLIPQISTKSEDDNPSIPVMSKE